MKNGLRVFFYLLAVATCLAAPNKAEAQVAEPLYHWRAAPGDTLMNSNPAAYAGGIILLQDSIPYAPDYTVIVVYKPVQDTEAMLWNIAYGDGSVRGLTTEHIQSDSIAIRYTPNTALEPAISTLRQTAPDSVSPKAVLNVGGTASVAELLYYGRRLGVAELRRVQSVLAVRYGVTLGPVDYLDSRGRRIWDYCDSGLYHHRVAGVGVDTLAHLSQLCSRSEMDGAVLTVRGGSLADRVFLMTGDDDGATVFADSGDCEVFGRTWRAQLSGASDTAEIPFTLVFDTHGMEPPTDSLVLLTADGVHLPAAMGGDSVVFSDVVFPAGTSLFTLARGASLWQTALTGNRSLVAGTPAFSASVHPNPSDGHYMLEVSGAERVQVTVYNMQGTAVASFSDGGRRHYRFEGDLPGGNVYFATVATESGSQTLKLVVK